MDDRNSKRKFLVDFLESIKQFNSEDQAYLNNAYGTPIRVH
jgi:hypothetical protein